MIEYKSCWWLQDHLEFSFGGGVHACCYNYAGKDGKTVGNVLLSRVKDNRFPAEEIAVERAKIHEKIAAGNHYACSGCPALELKEWPQPKYIVRLITMNVWSHCNLKCTYCVVGSPGFRPTHVSYDVVAVIGDMLASGHVDPAGQVTWGGGDISALPEFNVLAAMFREHGLHQDFKTSAYKFLPGVADAIAARRGAVEVSIDAGTPETYALVKGKDALERVMGNLRRYRECGPVNLKYIASDKNLGEPDIDGFVQIVEEIKPQAVTITPDYNVTWSTAFHANTVARMATLIQAVRATGHYVSPSNTEEGRRLFPNIWDDIELQLTARPPAPHAPNRVVGAT